MKLIKLSSGSLLQNSVLIVCICKAAIDQISNGEECQFNCVLKLCVQNALSEKETRKVGKGKFAIKTGEKGKSVISLISWSAQHDEEPTDNCERQRPQESVVQVDSCRVVLISCCDCELNYVQSWKNKPEEAQRIRSVWIL